MFIFFRMIFSLFAQTRAVSYTHLYDARLEAAVTPKKQSMDKVKIKNKEDLTFDKDVVNILLVGSDNGAQGSEDGDHGRSDSMMVATINFKTKELKLTSFLRDRCV